MPYDLLNQAKSIHQLGYRAFATGNMKVTISVKKIAKCFKKYGYLIFFTNNRIGDVLFSIKNKRSLYYGRIYI